MDHIRAITNGHLSPSLPIDRFRIFFGKVPAELLSPESHGLMRDDDPTSCQHILDHSQTERKPDIELNGMGNHVSRKSVATIKRITGKSGHTARSHLLFDARLTFTAFSSTSFLHHQDQAEACAPRPNETIAASHARKPHRRTFFAGGKFADACSLQKHG
jgi:hypothetical protein